MSNNEIIKICVVGAGGRMGKFISSVIYADAECDAAGAVDRAGAEAVGQPVYEYAGAGKGGAVISADLVSSAREADVIIDFTGASVTMSHYEEYLSLGKPLVIGSTGFTNEQIELLKKMSEKAPVLLSPNMSLGVNVLFKLAAEAAKALGGYDIEIVETHHKMKKDAPSGTAMGIAKAVAEAIDADLDKQAVYERHGIIGERKDGEIGIQTLRGGDVVGDHTVFFFGSGERIEITHRAHTRATFAEGAVRAAKWLKNKPAGFYSMKDVLFGGN